jgi:hypothetical protein
VFVASKTPRAHDVGVIHSSTIARADLRPSSGLEAVAVELFLVSGHVACAPNSDHYGLWRPLFKNRVIWDSDPLHYAV